VICVVISLLTQNKTEREHRASYHTFLSETASLAPDKRILRPVAWAVTLAWMFFAIGPGVVIGTDLFGAPNKGKAAWILGMPSIWGWQVVWWALGILVIWFLAYRLELSTRPRGEIEQRVEGIRTRL
jgi:hypothetical protein